MKEAVKRLIISDDFPTLLQLGLVSPLAVRNVQMIEYYEALKSAGVAPLRAVRLCAKQFRMSIRQVYYVKNQYGIA